VPVEDFDWAYATEVDHEQLWAQILHLYKAGFDWQLTRTEIEQQQKQNQQYEDVSPLEDAFTELVEVTGDDEDAVPSMTLKEDLKRIAGRYHLRELDEILKKHGISTEAVQRTDPRTGKRPRWYVGLRWRPTATRYNFTD
jgi:predicted P-loop ATPase